MNEVQKNWPEAKIQRKLRENLEYFKNERDNCIDDIPKKILEPEDPDYEKYKCRMGFFTGITSKLDRMLSHKMVVNEEAVRKCRAFMDYVQGMSTSKTEPEDIQEANKFLDFIIDYLEKN